MIKNKTTLRVRTDRQERVVRPCRYWDRAIDERAFSFIPEGVLAIAKNSTEFLKNEVFNENTVPSNMHAMVYNFHNTAIEKIGRVAYIYTKYADKNIVSRFLTRRCAERQLRAAVNDLVNYTVKHAPAVTLFKVDRLNVVNFSYKSYYQFMLAIGELNHKLRQDLSVSDIPGLVQDALALDSYYSNVGDQRFHNRVLEGLQEVKTMATSLQEIDDTGMSNAKLSQFVETMIEYVRYAETRYSYQFGPGAHREHVTQDLPFHSVGQAFVQTAADITNKLTVLVHLGQLTRA